MAGLPQRCGQRVHREVQPQLPHVLRHGRVACVLAAVTCTQTMWRSMNNLIFSRFSLFLSSSLPMLSSPLPLLTLSAFLIVSSFSLLLYQHSLSFRLLPLTLSAFLIVSSFSLLLYQHSLSFLLSSFSCIRCTSIVIFPGFAPSSSLLFPLPPFLSFFHFYPSFLSLPVHN
jgi:hypothetical protein